MSCKTPDNDQPALKGQLLTAYHPLFVDRLEAAHNKIAALHIEAFSIDFSYTDEEGLQELTLTTTPRGSKLRLDHDGFTTILDASNLYSESPHPTSEHLREQILKWQYLFLLPYKLSDDGTQWKQVDHNHFVLRHDGSQEEIHLHSYKNENLINKIVHVSTDGKSTSYLFEDYQPYKNIPISRKWTIYSDDTLIGHVNIASVIDMEVLEETFDTSHLRQVL